MTADFDGRDSVFASYYESGQQLHLSDAIDLADDEDDVDGRATNPAEEFAQFVIDQMEKGNLPPWAMGLKQNAVSMQLGRKTLQGSELLLSGVPVD